MRSTPHSPPFFLLNHLFIHSLLHKKKKKRQTSCLLSYCMAISAAPSETTLTILQAFCTVTRQGASTLTAPQITIAAINIRSRFDPRSRQQIVLWNDIVKVFKHACNTRIFLRPTLPTTTLKSTLYTSYSLFILKLTMDHESIASKTSMHDLNTI